MKKIKLLSIAAILLLCVSIFAGCGGGGSTSSGTSSSSSSPSPSTSPSPTAQSILDFKLTNAIGEEIYGVYVSPVGAASWEEDIMGQDTLANGASVDISFDTSKKDEFWDLMVTDANGNNVTFQNIDLSITSEITLKVENGSPVAETK